MKAQVVKPLSNFLYILTSGERVSSREIKAKEVPVLGR